MQRGKKWSSGKTSWQQHIETDGQINELGSLVYHTRSELKIGFKNKQYGKLASIINLENMS